MKRLLTCLLLLLSLQTLSFAQAPPGPATPAKEHEWLKQFVGEWEATSEGSMGAGQPTIKCEAVMKGRMLGGLWLIMESEQKVMGMAANSQLTVGYDPNAKQYVGSWVDSVMTTMWRYQGSVDATGKILTLEADGPDLTDPTKKAKYRDVYEFKSADEIRVTSQMAGADGKWTPFMSGIAKRKK